LCVFCLAVLNEIPDYYQDMLVGKRNLVVRFGRQKAIFLLKLCFAGIFALLLLAIALKKISLLASVAFITLPLILKSIERVEKNYDNPELFLFSVNSIVVTYIVIVLSLGLSFLKG